MELTILKSLQVLQNPQAGFDRRLDVAKALLTSLRFSFPLFAPEPHPQELHWEDVRALERFLPAFTQLLSDRSELRLSLSFTNTPLAHHKYELRSFLSLGIFAQRLPPTMPMLNATSSIHSTLPTPWRENLLSWPH